MRNFLGTLVIVLAIAGAVGWFLDWFEASMDFTVNKDKIKADFNLVRQTISDSFQMNRGE